MPMPLFRSECVFPALVWPYARMEPLYPCSTSFRTGFPTSSYTSFCVHLGSKTPSKEYAFSVTFPGAADPPARTRSTASSSTRTTHFFNSWWLVMQCWSPSSRASPGRTREKTFTLPFTLMVSTFAAEGKGTRKGGIRVRHARHVKRDNRDGDVVGRNDGARRQARETRGDVVPSRTTSVRSSGGTTRQGARGGEAGAVIRGAYLRVSCNLPFCRG